MGKIIFTAFFVALAFAAHSFQSGILFSIGENQTSKEEFAFFYKKNSQSNPEAFARADIEDYLRLFIDFKLKVKQAEDLGYDTTANFTRELNIYLGQLTESFMNSNTSEEKLYLEAYERMQFDIDASHILVRLSENPKPSDTLPAYQKARSIYDRAKSGENFGELAVQYSEEPGAAMSKGHLGYFTAFQMVYPFETAAYSIPVNGISTPVRSQFGYHIIKVNNRRPAMGTVTVAHIMLRFNRDMQSPDSLEVRQKIDMVYDDLTKGASWDSVCVKYSEDINSKVNGGRLRPFGIRGLNVPEFELAAHETPVAEISDPFKTPFGWHVLKVIGKNTIGTFEEERAGIVRKVQNDARSRLPKEEWLSHLKERYKFEEKNDLSEKVTFLYDSTQSPAGSVILFTLEDQSYSQLDLEAYAKSRNILDGAGALLWYNKFIEDELRNREEKFLLQNNLEYRMLRNEYYQGILLFSIMEDKVWKKAERDSVGLRNYYKNNSDRFLVAGKKGIVISVEPDSLTDRVFNSLLLNFKDLHANYDISTVKNWTDAVLSSQSRLTLRFAEKVFQEGNSALENIDSGINLITNDGTQAILVLADETGNWVGQFEDVKGLAISFYQDILEENWINELHNNYKVKINKKVLKQVINELESR
jgi:peptidyl-prolyl cis-trans isomerase SurA